MAANFTRKQVEEMMAGGGGASRQLVGDPYLMQVTGNTNWQYFEVADLAQLNMQPGDKIDFDALWEYTKSTNGKTPSIAFGLSEASVTQITSSTRSVATESVYRMRVELWKRSSTVFIAQTSMPQPYGQSPNDLGVFTIDPASKIYMRAQLANAGEQISLLTMQRVVTRGRA